MGAELEVVHGDLAEDGGEVVLDLAGQQSQPGGGRGLGVEQAAEDDHLAENRGRLGRGQRRVGLQVADAVGQVLVDGVAQLVGQGHHVADGVGVAGQDVGVGTGGAAHAESAAALGGAQLGVDPALVEGALGDAAEGLGEGVVALQHDVLPVVPVVGGQVGAERGVAVVVEQLVQAQQAPLEPVVAADDGEAAHAGGDEGVDRLLGDLVGQVAGGHGGGIAAQAVVGGVVLEADVEDVGEGVEAVAQGLGHAGGGGLPGFAVGVVAEGQGLGLGEGAGLALDGDVAGEAAGELAKQAAPGAAAGVGLLVQ